MLECTLEFLLLRVAAFYGVSVGMHYLASRSDALPQSTIVELPRVGVPRRVVDVLHVGEDRYPVHGSLGSA